MCSNEFGIGGTNEREGITMHNLDFIADPLHKKLMQGRWYTLVGMNPITSKYEVKVILHLGDGEEEGEREGGGAGEQEAEMGEMGATGLEDGSGKSLGRGRHVGPGWMGEFCLSYVVKKDTR